MKRPQTLALGLAAKAKVKRAGYEPVPEGSPETITTAIHIPKATWNLLRSVAFHRAQDQGGRASVSKLIAEIVETHRQELEHEVKG